MRGARRTPRAVPSSNDEGGRVLATPGSTKMEKTWREKIEGTTDQVLAQIRKLLDEGNIRRVVVKNQGTTVAEFPLTVGLVGTVLAPLAAAIGALTAVLADCTIEVERTVPPGAAAPAEPRVEIVPVDDRS